ncbi:hypothetical protein ACFYT4_21235 [Streptomyces sp. NPDC004609]|uniref:hypothetical protein n=1 Tax=Streptomyces sp. NPDC004609 TaxID=3364704 RepID=UPI0036929616
MDRHAADWTGKGAAPMGTFPGKELAGTPHPGGHVGSGAPSHPGTDGGFPPQIAHPHPLDPGKAPMSPHPPHHTGPSPYGDGPRPSGAGPGGGDRADQGMGSDDVPMEPTGGSGEFAGPPPPPQGTTVAQELEGTGNLGGTAVDDGEPGAGTADGPLPPNAPPTAPVRSAEESQTQVPSASGDTAAPGHPLAGEGFGATAFDFDGGCPDSGPAPDLAPASPDTGTVATEFDGFAFPGPSEPMA